MEAFQRLLIILYELTHSYEMARYVFLAGV